MTKEDKDKLEEELSTLSVEEKKQRDLYLRSLASGEVLGPPAGYASIDKPWLKFYSKESLLENARKISVYENLKLQSSYNLEKVAINYYGKKYTYRDLINEIDRVAEMFYLHGVRKGDIVTLSLPNIPENVFCFYALNKIGAIANFIDLRLMDDKLVSAINSTNSKFIVTTDLFIGNLDKVFDRTTLEKVVVASPSDSLPFIVKQLYCAKNGIKKVYENGYMSWNQFRGQKRFGGCLVKSNVPSENEPVCILHTSGTTSEPKGAILTNENFLEMAIQVKNSGLKYKSDDVFLNQVPPFLAYNILAAVNNPLTMGLEIRMLPDYKPEEFAKNIYKYKPNHVIAGPADWNNFLENDEFFCGKDLSFLVSMISGSDKIPEHKKSILNQFFSEHGCEEKILEGYGMTEVGAAAVLNVPQHNVSDSVGIPLRNVNIGIFEEDSELELGYNSEGEICMSGPTVMKEYLNNELETRHIKRVHEDGTVWIHSGDFGYIDENGNLFLKGRIKRVIVNHEGFKISPMDVEKVLNSSPLVENSCVVGIDDVDKGFGKVAVAAIVLKPEVIMDDDSVENELKKLCAEKLGERYRPSKYYIKKQLPLTDVGKVNYRELEREFSEKVKQKTLKK